MHPPRAREFAYAHSSIFPRISFSSLFEKKGRGGRESHDGDEEKVDQDEIEHGWNKGFFIEFLSFERFAMVGSDGFDGFVTMIQRHVRFGSNGVLWKRRVNEWNWIDWQIYTYIYAILVMLVDRGKWIMFRSSLTWRCLGIICDGISGIDRNDDNEIFDVFQLENYGFLNCRKFSGKEISIKRLFQRIKFLI